MTNLPPALGGDHRARMKTSIGSSDGDNVADGVPSRPSWYRRRSPFLFFARLTKHELYAVDGFVESRRGSLEIAEREA